MEDIRTTEDIKLLVDTFYGKVKTDPVIGFIFNDIIGTNWDGHMPQMYKFWNMVLLSKPGYEGYPTKKHLAIDRKIPLQQEHFDQWLKLWEETLDSLFEGDLAEQAKGKAKLMSDLISIKIADDRKGNLIQ